MSFILVDYDHGCGGEYFSYTLSISPQCHTLERKTINKRTKVFDVFQQEFLKFNPNINNISIPVLDEKHIIVPVHQQTNYVKNLLLDCKSIRIKYPSKLEHHLFVVKCIQEKVLNATQLGISEWSGFVKLFFDDNNKEFLKKLNLKMNNFDIILWSKGIEPTNKNKKKYVQNLIDKFPKNEPTDNYDVVIEFSELIEDIDAIIKRIKDILQVDMSRELLLKYETEYQTFRHYGSILV
jgi:hypothetical protein